MSQQARQNKLLSLSSPEYFLQDELKNCTNLIISLNETVTDIERAKFVLTVEKHAVEQLENDMRTFSSGVVMQTVVSYANTRLMNLINFLSNEDYKDDELVFDLVRTSIYTIANVFEKATEEIERTGDFRSDEDTEDNNDEEQEE